MEHEYWEVMLQGYLDNELSPADHAAVQNHIEECPDCGAHLAYTKAMKRRLHAFRDSVSMPESVERRIRERVQRKRRGVVVRFFKPAYGIALAAVILLAIALPRWLPDASGFADCNLSGKIACPDCHIAAQTGLVMGELCRDGHTLGIVCDNGRAYRIAMDARGLELKAQLEAAYGKQITLEGKVLESERLVRVRDLMDLIVTRATMFP